MVNVATRSAGPALVAGGPVQRGLPSACNSGRPGTARTLAGSIARLPGAGVAPGAVEIGFSSAGGRTRLSHLYQRNPQRAFFPLSEPDDRAALAVLVTTSGGLVAGDRIVIDIRAEADAVAHVTTSAAEKIYRSTGATTQIAQSIAVGARAWLECLPQETILFDGARLRRHTTVAVAPGGGFLGGNILIFGRRARSERFTYGLLHEGLEVRLAGHLVWGDALHIDGGVATMLDDAACFDGAAACATLILAPPDGEPARFVDRGRAAQARMPTPGLRAGITVVNGIVVARWLAAEAAALRRAFADLACLWRHAAMGLPARLPRLWSV
jgi:urease accessory protein